MGIRSCFNISDERTPELPRWLQPRCTLPPEPRSGSQPFTRLYELEKRSRKTGAGQLRHVITYTKAAPLIVFRVADESAGRIISRSADS